jgi:DNA polymerase III epsilon subunit-like protein
MKLIFLDTETTGNESKDRLCQLAYKEAGDGEKFSELFKPPLPHRYRISRQSVTSLTRW